MTIKLEKRKSQVGSIKPAKPYREYLLGSLKDPQEAAGYLNEAMQDDDPRVFLLALRDVVAAYGATKASRESGLNRENAYRILSAKGNPRLSSLAALLKVLNLRLSVEARS